jgi:hypothetical protein
MLDANNKINNELKMGRKRKYKDKLKHQQTYGLFSIEEEKIPGTK